MELCVNGYVFKLEHCGRAGVGWFRFTGCAPFFGSLLEHDSGHEIVPDQNQDETKHHRLGCRLANADGALWSIEPFVAAHPRNDKAEAERF